MRYLLDTHVLIWMDAEPEKLSQRVYEVCEDVSNELVFSYASIWEMQIKHQLGKLSLRAPIRQIITEQRENGLLLANIELSHIYGLANLPPHHRDPFDRLLVAQAQVEGLVLLTHDADVQAYPIATLW